MSFEEMITELKKVKCQEQRGEYPDYLEIVVGTTDLSGLVGPLETYFGAPLKPEGKLPNLTAMMRAKPYGGVRQNQTMYYRKEDAFTAVALFWPWGSGEMVTVKVLREKP